MQTKQKKEKRKKGFAKNKKTYCLNLKALSARTWSTRDDKEDAEEKRVKEEG